jgi:hypothetical protein
MKMQSERKKINQNHIQKNQFENLVFCDYSRNYEEIKISVDSPFMDFELNLIFINFDFPLTILILYFLEFLRIYILFGK